MQRSGCDIVQAERNSALILMYEYQGRSISRASTQHPGQSLFQSRTRESAVMPVGCLNLTKIFHLIISTGGSTLSLASPSREDLNFPFSNDARLDSKVAIDFYKLKQMGSTSAKSIENPIEKVIVGQVVILKVVADTTTWCEIELKNETFYPYLFFFDNICE